MSVSPCRITSLYVAVIICVTVVNTQTYRDIHERLSSGHKRKTYTISTAPSEQEKTRRRIGQL